MNNTRRPTTANTDDLRILVPTGSDKMGVLGVGSIPVAILPSCQDIKNIAL